MDFMRYLVGICVAVIALANCARGAEVGKVAAQPTTRAVADRIPNTPVTIEMVQVPGGKITLKDEAGKEHVHEIKPFLIGKYEVRWDEWDVMYYGLNLEKDFPDERLRKIERDKRVDAVLAPSRVSFDPPDRGWGHLGSPVQAYTLRTANRFAEWLSKATGKKYRLPTEAEWEWACRAGGPPVKLEGKELEAVAWVSENSDEQTHPAGTKRANAWGLHDMLGNVAEFVIRDPKDEKGLAAGGSFWDGANEVSSSTRESFTRKWQLRDPQEPKSVVRLESAPHIGFRLVRDVEAEQK